MKPLPHSQSYPIRALAQLAERCGATSFRIGFFQNPERTDTRWWCMVEFNPGVQAVIDGTHVEVAEPICAGFPNDIDFKDTDDEGDPTDQFPKGTETPAEAADGLARSLLEGGECIHCGSDITVETRTKGRCKWTRTGPHWESACQKASSN